MGQLLSRNFPACAGLENITACLYGIAEACLQGSFRCPSGLIFAAKALDHAAPHGERVSQVRGERPIDHTVQSYTAHVAEGLRPYVTNSSTILCLIPSMYTQGRRLLMPIRPVILNPEYTKSPARRDAIPVRQIRVERDLLTLASS